MRPQEGGGEGEKCKGGGRERKEMSKVGEANRRRGGESERQKGGGERWREVKRKGEPGERRKGRQRPNIERQTRKE